MALGFQQQISERALFTLGGSFSGSESAVGVGFGVSW